ncbi:Cyclin [Theobroma cacao]|nr:Cyclin [Theobroma cacao]
MPRGQRILLLSKSKTPAKLVLSLREMIRLRKKSVEFLIQSSQQLQATPLVKYTALSLFADRFLPSVTTLLKQGNELGSWLLRSMEDSNLQLFALISIWISSKIHDSRALSVKSLKPLGDKFIKDQHFTTRDFLEAVLNFEIGTSNVAFIFLEELFIRFKGMAKVGELVSFEACMDVMDLLYEKEETLLHMWSQSLNNSLSFLFFLGVSFSHVHCIIYFFSIPPASKSFSDLVKLRFDL